MATAHLHPASKHFPISMGVVFLTTLVGFVVILIVLTIGLKIVGVMRQIRALKGLGRPNKAHLALNKAYRDIK